MGTVLKLLNVYPQSRQTDTYGMSLLMLLLFLKVIARKDSVR